MTSGKVTAAGGAILGRDDDELAQNAGVKEVTSAQAKCSSKANTCTRGVSASPTEDSSGVGFHADKLSQNKGTFYTL